MWWKHKLSPKPNRRHCRKKIVIGELDSSTRIVVTEKKTCVKLTPFPVVLVPWFKKFFVCKSKKLMVSSEQSWLGLGYGVLLFGGSKRRRW